METETMEQVQVPVQSDVSEAIPLSQKLSGMSRDQLVKYADGLGLQIDGRVKESTIREAILRLVQDQKNQAAEINAVSLKQTVSEKDPVIAVRFFNLESAGADLEFSYSEPLGMFGPRNSKGHKKCPKWHLFPGEVTKMAYSVYEHISGLTFVTHKTVWDTNTGMITGTIPIIKPRFLLQPILTKEDLISINKNR